MKKTITTEETFKKWRLLHLFLICSVIYLSQFYPYTHIHHSHIVHNKLFDSRFYPSISIPGNEPNNHKDDHNHHSIDQHLNDYCIANLQIDKSGLLNGFADQFSILEIDSDIKCIDDLIQDYDRIPLKLLFSATVNPRSPPL
jgi:hypothetical protein